MLNRDIHAGLDRAEVRDFLSQSIGHGYPGEVEILEARIAQLNAELEAAKKSQAARQLIADNGWERFDVSDDIEDYRSGEYFSFVGTKSELFDQGLGDSCYERPQDNQAAD